MDYPDRFVPEEVDVTDELPISFDDHKAFYQTNAGRVFESEKESGRILIATVRPSRESAAR